ncbi:MAG: aminotransferase class V-fold PLP-dependent enzyme [Gemmatimonadetes bacterium]|nr:aminotransferase class V-fold PLP-dependent enzyme [Gemmatimonadota bacterium]
MSRFEELRHAEFAALDGQGIYLNSASIGPMPSRSVAVLAACNRDRAKPGLWSVDRLNAVLSESRWLSARLINAAEDEIALMPNTTTGLNVAARALPLGAGDVVLTFDGEFPSNIYPYLVRGGEGIVLERIPRTVEGWPDEARLHERLADPAVKAVAVSLTQFSNGYTLDLAALSRATRALGKWLVVDAIQAVGQVPIDVQATPVDFLACGAQKWLLSPWGTGFLYVRRALIGTITPTFAGWAAFQGTDDYSQLTAYNPEPWPDARRFELITLPVQDFAAMNASVGLLLEVGVSAIAAHLRSLHAPIIAWAEANGATITSAPGARGCGILCLRPRGDVPAAYQRLQGHGVMCSLREGSVRLSPHLFTLPHEASAVVEMLDR